MENILEKVENLNKFLDKHLNIKNLKNNHLKQVFYKIVYENLYSNIKNFSNTDTTINKDSYNEYVEKISSFLLENFYLKENININDIKKLHKIIMKDLVLEEINIIGDFRKTPLVVYQYDLKGKKSICNTTSPKYVEKEMIKTIETYNKDIKTNANKLLVITEFIIDAFLIHPFGNGNGKVFWILYDILLFKYDYFPIIILRKEVKKKVYKEVFAHYISTWNRNILIKQMLVFISNLYKNYKL